jgi:hypothetical protein
MILFPKSSATYTGQVGDARRVIIDGQFYGDLVEVRRGGVGVLTKWMVVLWGGIAGGNVFGNADFTTREHALNYIKACAFVHDHPQARAIVRGDRSNGDFWEPVS